MQKDDYAVLQLLQRLEGKKVKELFHELGYHFSEELEPLAQSDGYECPFQYFIDDARACCRDPLSEEGFKTEIKSFVSLSFLVKNGSSDEEFV